MKLTKQQREEWAPWMELVEFPSWWLLFSQLSGRKWRKKVWLVGCALTIGKWLDEDLTLKDAKCNMGFCSAAALLGSGEMCDEYCPIGQYCDTDQLWGEAIDPKNKQARAEFLRVLLDVYKELYEDYYGGLNA